MILQVTCCVGSVTLSLSRRNCREDCCMTSRTSVGDGVPATASSFDEKYASTVSMFTMTSWNVGCARNMANDSRWYSSVYTRLGLWWRPAVRHELMISRTIRITSSSTARSSICNQGDIATITVDRFNFVLDDSFYLVEVNISCDILAQKINC